VVATYTVISCQCDILLCLVAALRPFVASAVPNVDGCYYR